LKKIFKINGPLLYIKNNAYGIRSCVANELLMVTKISSTVYHSNTIIRKRRTKSCPSEIILVIGLMNEALKNLVSWFSLDNFLEDNMVCESVVSSNIYPNNIKNHDRSIASISFMECKNRLLIWVFINCPEKMVTLPSSLSNAGIQLQILCFTTLTRFR